MNNEQTESGSNNSVFLRLHQRFYNDGKVVFDKSASVYWRDASRRFTVRDRGNEEFQLAGFAFGESGSNRLRNHLFSWAGNTIHLSYLKMAGLRQDVSEAKAVVSSMGLVFSQDAFRQVCVLNFLVRAMQNKVPPRLIMIIGDGHGILSALLHARFPEARIMMIDLGSVLFFQSYHLHKAFPDASQVIADEAPAGDESTFTFCPADRLEALPKGNIDLAVNVASMQEMDPAITARYFDLLRQRATGLFYCCNRLEKHIGKNIIRFMEFPWLKKDVHLVDESCPWHQWFFGLGSSPNVRFAGIPVPFMHKYDGQHWNRLTVLAKSEKNE